VPDFRGRALGSPQWATGVSLTRAGRFAAWPAMAARALAVGCWRRAEGPDLRIRPMPPPEARVWLPAALGFSSGRAVVGRTRLPCRQPTPYAEAPPPAGPLPFPQAGGVLIPNELRWRIEERGGGPASVLTPLWRYEADAVLVSGGAWSGLLKILPIVAGEGEVIPMLAAARRGACRRRWGWGRIVSYCVPPATHPPAHPPPPTKQPKPRPRPPPPPRPPTPKPTPPTHPPPPPQDRNLPLPPAPANHPKKILAVCLVGAPSRRLVSIPRVIAPWVGALGGREIRALRRLVPKSSCRS